VLADNIHSDFDLLAGVTAETTIIVHDGTAWTTGSLDHVTPGAAVRVWTSDYAAMKKPGPDQGVAETIAIGPADLW
jgi:hypothetical protein